LEVKIMAEGSKENKAFVVALITMIGGFAMLAFFPERDAVIIPLMTFVLGYYFGSSPGSHSKDSTISDLAKSCSLQSGTINGNGKPKDPVVETVKPE